MTGRDLNLGYKSIGRDGVSLLSGVLTISSPTGTLYIGGLHPQSPEVHAQTHFEGDPWGIIFVPFAVFHTYVDAVYRAPELWVLLDHLHPSLNCVVTFPISA